MYRHIYVGLMCFSVHLCICIDIHVYVYGCIYFCVGNDAGNGKAARFGYSSGG